MSNACPKLLQDRITNCTACPLNQLPYKPGLPTQTYGSSSPKILFLVEAPGAQEAIEGIPLVGKAGQKIFWPVINKLGLTLNDIAISNSCKHRPPENRNPTPEELKACQQHLIDELLYLQPKQIIALGKIPTQTLLMLAGKEMPSHSLRGGSFTLPIQGFTFPVAVTHHPAYMLYNPSKLSEFEKDIAFILKEIK